MRSSPPTISSSDLATRAREVARSTGLQSLPVTKDGRLEGVVTSRDLLHITSTRSNIPVLGLMTPPIIVATPEWSIAKLARKTIQADISLVPVTQSSTDKSLLGVVRLEDVLEKISEAPEDGPKVKDVMSREVITCNPKDRVTRVWNIMEETNFSGIPVTQKQKVIGMITRSDIIKSGKARLATESEGGRTPPKVETLMKSPPRTIKADKSINKAIQLMVGQNIGRLPIVEDEKLIGILDREDVIKPYL
ncbi:hypothetical protein AKJ47_02990 [candidate division MSBL1 archaeon SCGC-AAA261G05]|uniref:CBS domain-containing protein n=1 Tax=candidate division MSBL1 archaeon SCGC-AAA261G05 TaxID=1698276 RepID=A0A133V992_9EURY|nr:hypothetical protein AKJ47_02990 [candidate division MSBL1 archaeon SCGC-AAA261G05]